MKHRYLNSKASIVVAPDMGRAKSAARFAARLGLPFAAADKRRISDKQVHIGGMIAKQVEGYSHAIIFDDEIATGTSVITLSHVLVDCGISEIATVCTHGVFVDDALKKLQEFPEISQIVSTDTVPIPTEKRVPKLEILSVAPLFAEAIWKNYAHQSIGDLFTYSEDRE
jgi:ribose-phosphate pyrophosphokinase